MEKSKKHQQAQAQIETGGAIEQALTETTVQADGWTITFESESTSPRASVEKRGDITLVHFDLPADGHGEYTIVTRQPMIDIHRSWVGSVDCWRGSELTSIALNYSFDSAANQSMPIICNYNRYGINRGTIGLLDQLPITHINQRAEIEAPPMQWLRTRFTRTFVKRAKRETVAIARDPVHFVQAVRQFMAFCRNANQITPMPAPDWARLPVWCTWYSHLYSLTQQDVVSHIPRLKELGFETVLIDASWFKPREVALHRVWGDFVPHTPLMPDLRGLSRRLHDEGLKLMLWCAPMYAGTDARCRAQMEPWCVHDGNERTDWLCMHCAEAHDFAGQMVRRVMQDYELDGLKLDFMDKMAPTCIDPQHDHGDGDFGPAVTRFMATVRDAIVSVNPNAAIEYRLRYSTLSTLPYANCHRGNDAPYDADYIRRENLHVRLFADYPSAAWSDYAYWHDAESPENVSAMLGQQILSGGVPTVSINLEQCSAAHRKIIADWLTFYHEHAEALARADLQVHSADSHMSVSSLTDNNVAYILLAGQHIPAKLALAPQVDTVWLLNCSAEAQGAVNIRSQSHDLQANTLIHLKL